MKDGDQCSQPSGDPTGPGGRTAKTPGPDGTADVPSPSAKSKEGRYYLGRRARQPEAIMCKGA